MISIGRYTERTCQGLTRRAFLQMSAAAPFALGRPARAAGATTGQGRARSILLIWLGSTLLLCMGEFGRTPRINSIGSRDHWHHCYSSIWAGAGVRGGHVVGESDARGEHPASEPITPAWSELRSSIDWDYARPNEPSSGFFRRDG